VEGFLSKRRWLLTFMYSGGHCPRTGSCSRPRLDRSQGAKGTGVYRQNVISKMLYSCRCKIGNMLCKVRDIVSRKTDTSYHNVYCYLSYAGPYLWAGHHYRIMQKYQC
jgi:hypothetical protein